MNRTSNNSARGRHGGRDPVRGVPRPAAVLAVLLLAALGLRCSERFTDAPTEPTPPKTFLWLAPDSTVGVGVSRQHLHWWAEDPDGTVSGFLFGSGVVTGTVVSPPQPDTLRYQWVSTTDTVIAFSLDTLFRRFLVVVRGVDNTFPRLPERSVVRVYPTAYWDVNDNGVFDAGDQSLGNLPPAMDPRGAALTFPVRNTPPRISFMPSPLDPSAAPRQPDTTYTAATFSWKGSDFDGDVTLASYEIALNDTSDPSRWVTLPLRDTVVSIVVPRARSDAAGAEVTADMYAGPFLGRRYLGQIQGLRLDALNVLYLRVRDLAGEYSPTISMPSGTETWYVRKPRGRLLLVSDYISFDAQLALTTYRASLDAVPGGTFAGADNLDIGAGLTPSDKSLGKPGRLVPAFIDPALIYTFLLYDQVLWYTDQYPSLGVAQLTLLTYQLNGGRVLFSTTFLNTADPRGALRDFAPIDSVSSVDLSPTRPPVPPAVAGDSRVPGNYAVLPDSPAATAQYPRLAFNSSPTIHSIFMRPVYRRTDARYIYRLQADTQSPVRYLGEPNVAVVDGQRRIIFFGLPLHLLNNTTNGNPAGLSGFLEIALTREFNAAQKVNRRKF